MSEQCREHAHVFKTAKKDCAYCRIAELKIENSGLKNKLQIAQEKVENQRSRLSKLEQSTEGRRAENKGLWRRIKELAQENKELQEKCDYFEKKYEDAIFNGMSHE